MATEILGIRGNIFDFSDYGAQCGCFWIKRGFTGLSLSYVEYINRTKDISLLELRTDRQEIIHAVTLDHYAYNTFRPRFFKVNQGTATFQKYIYLFPNPGDRPITDLNEVNHLIQDLLSVLSLYKIESFAMNGMMGAGDDGRRCGRMDLQIKQRVLFTMSEWLNNNPTSIKKVFLIDKGNGWMDVNLLFT